MKALKKLIPAAAMLLLCAAMMTTATFAWFNMNQSVGVDTGTTNVTAPTNIQIAKWSKTDNVYTLGEYSAKADFSDPADTVPILPATVKNDAGALKWQTTSTAGNDGAAVGNLTDLTLDDDGIAGGVQYFKKFEMNIKNIGGATIDVKLDPTVAVSPKEAVDVTPSPDLYKSVCFMIFVGTVGSTAPTTTAVGATPVIVWDDGSDMQTADSLIKGSVTDKTAKFVTLEAQQNANVTVIAWMEGEKKACANNNVKSDALAFGLTLSLKADAVTA